MNTGGNTTETKLLPLKTEPVLDFLVVGIGASAGGLEAMGRLLRDTPEPLEAALVLVQHLDPLRPSFLTQLLQKSSRLPVIEILDGMQLQKGRVFVLPPGKELHCEGPILRLTDRPREEEVPKPIDFFFKSLAQTQGPKALGIILSGTGNDGCEGIAAIKAHGGHVLVQAPDTAKFSQMPQEALATGYVDHILHTDRMSQVWSSLLSDGVDDRRDFVLASPSPDIALPKNHYEPILDFLSQRFRVDFKLYKSSTLKRRILRRTSLRKMESAQAYLELLKRDSKEVQDLLDDLLIHVTSFFRDPEVFSFLENKVIPDLMAGLNPIEPLRIWVAGCSTGEEVYSLAILCDEARQRNHGQTPIQIFASDVSERIIAQARTGFFSLSQVEGLSAERLQRYFHPLEHGYQVVKSLRDCCVFAVHNLAADPPFSRMDLVTCRNVLIYLTPLLQKRIVPTFHFALKPSGYLLLGSAESIGPFEHLFHTVDKSYKVFQRLEGKGHTLPHLSREFSVEQKMSELNPALTKSEVRTSADVMRDAEQLLLRRYGPCALVLDDKLQILAIYGDSSPYLKLPSGPLSAQLTKFAHEDLIEPIRSLARKAKASSQSESRTLRMGISGERSGIVQLDIHPFSAADQSSGYLLLVLQNISAEKTSHQQWGRQLTAKFLNFWGSRREDQKILESLQRELLWSKENFRLLEAKIQDQSLIDENLKSANEEILSSNEELQSTNEELETSKEELQSTVEELNTVNEQLSNRNAELLVLNSDLNNLLNNANIPLLILSKNLIIRRFTSAAATLFRLIPEDVGRHLSDINLHLCDLPVEKRVLEVMDQLRTGEWEVQSQDGNWYGLRIKPYRTLDDKIDGAVLTLIDIDLVQRSKNYAQAIVDTLHEPLTILDPKLEIVAVNAAFSGMFATTPTALEGRLLTDLIPELRSHGELQGLLNQIIPKNSRISNAQFTMHNHGEKVHVVTMNASRISVGQPKMYKILLSLDDMTAQTQAEAIQAQWSMIFEKSEMAIVLIDHQSEQISLANKAFADLYEIPRELLMGKLLSDLMAPESKSIELARLQTMELHEYLEYESWHLSHSGRLFPVFVKTQLIRDSQNHPLCRMLYIVDCTKSRQTEEERAKASRALEEANRAKTDFIANVSHEIRTPLAAILGYTELLASNGKNNMSSEECLARIRRNIVNVSEIIDEILDLSKVEAGKMDIQLLRFALQPELNEVFSLFQTTVVEKNLQLSCHIDGDVPSSIQSDPNRLRQILINVVGNAIKFTTKGSITVTVHKRQVPGPSGGRRLIVFHVQDTGIGISSDQQGLLFKAFSQADSSITRRFGGTGLGLTLSRSLARLLGGDLILVQSTPDEGSLFECSIEDQVTQSPVTTVLPEIEHTKAISSYQRESPLEGVRVLLVEDAPDLQAIYEFFLESFGAQMTIASNGQHALELAERQTFDIILMDLQMPVMDGYEATKILRSRGFQGPILALTAHAMQEERNRTQDAQFDDFLTKAISAEDLLKALMGNLSVRRGN